MSRRFILCLLLVLCGYSSVLVAAEPAPASAPETSTVEDQLEAAMADFAARSVEILAASKSPRERWIAGLMLLGDAMRNSGEAEKSEALRERGQQLLDDALKAGEDDPTLLFWALLDPPVRDSQDTQAMAAVRTRLANRLQQLEPENAVVWLGTMPPRDAPGAIPIAIDLLHKAAAAKRFDTHFAASMRMLIKAFARVPLPEHWPDTKGLAGWDGMQPEDVQVIMAVGVASKLSMPYLIATQWWCGGNSMEHPWMDDCRILARTMIDHSDSIVPYSMGLALVAQLYDADSSQTRQAVAQRRELAWLIENGLQRVGPGQPIPYSRWRRAWLERDATELLVARAMVKAQDLPLSPPDDFVPAWDREEAKPK